MRVRVRLQEGYSYSYLSRPGRLHKTISAETFAFDQRESGGTLYSRYRFIA